MSSTITLVVRMKAVRPGNPTGWNAATRSGAAASSVATASDRAWKCCLHQPLKLSANILASLAAC